MQCGKSWKGTPPCNGVLAGTYPFPYQLGTLFSRIKFTNSCLFWEPCHRSLLSTATINQWRYPKRWQKQLSFLPFWLYCLQGYFDFISRYIFNCDIRLLSLSCHLFTLSCLVAPFPGTNNLPATTSRFEVHNQHLILTNSKILFTKSVRTTYRPICRMIRFSDTGS